MEQGISSLYHGCVCAPILIYSQMCKWIFFPFFWPGWFHCTGINPLSKVQYPCSKLCLHNPCALELPKAPKSHLVWASPCPRLQAPFRHFHILKSRDFRGFTSLCCDSNSDHKPNAQWAEAPVFIIIIYYSLCWSWERKTRCLFSLKCKLERPNQQVTLLLGNKFLEFSP